MLPVWCGVVVFAVNNVLLARLLTSLPGGTPLGPTTMLAVAVAALGWRRFGAVTLLYATYGVLGTLGHLGVDAGTYVLHLPRVLLAALLFDAVLLLARFRPLALLAGALPCVGVFLFGHALAPRDWLITIGLAWVGLAAGIVGHAWAVRRRRG